MTVLDTADLWRETRSADVKKIIYIRRFLKIEDDLTALDFCRTKVTCDVIVLLKIIGAHSSDVITTEILQILLANYREKRATTERSFPGDNQPLSLDLKNQ